MGKAGRPKGSRNKASRELLWKLEKEHDFFVVQEIMDIYHEMGKVAKPLVERAVANAEAGLSPTNGFNDAELEMLNNTYKNRWTILEKLLAYCYPKLRALEVGTGADHDQITFNINVPKDKIDLGTAK